MFSVSDSSIYMIYCLSFNFPYVICYYLYLHTWTTSLDHVHVNVQNNDNVMITFFLCYVKIGYNVTHNVGYAI